MKRLHSTGLIVSALLLAAAFTGCGHPEGSAHDHEHEHEEEPPAGASFKEGKGVTLTDETRKIIGVEIADVAERSLPSEVRFTVQIFGEKHTDGSGVPNHAECDAKGSGFIPAEAAMGLKIGQRLELRRGTNAPLDGVVLEVKRPVTGGESEVVVGVPKTAMLLNPGEFATAVISLPEGKAVMTVPRDALLRTVEGAFVYAGNGNAYTRTAVVTGADSGGFVEVTDGLLAGDQVVTRGVAALWMVELRAIKGGAGCTH